MKNKIVVASGYFNPLHSGHLYYLEKAKKLGDKLIVIVNNDKQVKLKGSIPFMNENERVKIISSLKCVDKVFLSIDKDKTVCKSLEYLKPNFFAKGGDSTPKNVPELNLCKKLGARVVFNVGGKKTNSSSILIKKSISKNIATKPWGYFEILLEGKGFWFKKLCFNYGRTSLQSHKNRDEIWLIYVPKGIKHRIGGKGTVLELAIGNPKENDIIRYKDDYKRK